MTARRPLTQAEVLPHVDRFLGFVEKQASGCWFRYSRARDSGYTTITVNGRRIGAHRFAYAAFVGDIPAGMEVDHLCRDRACVNPDHLELVDRATNLARRDDANPGEFAARSLEDRIQSRVSSAGDCLVWTGALVRGYGVISVDGKTRYVHRIAWELVNGPIPDGMDLDHLCRNPRCLNLNHLEPVTRSENTARMLNKQPKDRCRRGHSFAEYGRTTNGACIACLEAATGRPYRPRRTNTDTHCPNGHAYADVGRYPSGGCRACQAEKDAARGQRKNADITLYCDRGHNLVFAGMRSGHCQACWDEGWCINGHDMNDTGRTPNGACRACREQRNRTYAKTRKGTCSRGHDLAEAGVNPANGECRECAREYAREKYGYKTTADKLERECKNGHTRTLENTRTITRTRNGQTTTERLCLDCRRDRQKRYETKKHQSE